MAPDYKKTNEFVRNFSERTTDCLKNVQFNYIKLVWDDSKKTYVQEESSLHVCVYSETE
jgi:hypothetical protein